MIYSPAHGDMAFTVPMFAEFMVRAIPNFKLSDDQSLILHEIQSVDHPGLDHALTGESSFRDLAPSFSPAVPIDHFQNTIILLRP
jgi:hypothetical protein